MGKTVADWHKEHFPFVLRRCKYMLRNMEDAEDAAQETFIRVFMKEEQGMDLTKINNEESLLWVYATNVCLTRIEKRKKKEGNNVSLFEECLPTDVNDIDKLEARMFLQSIIEQESKEIRLYCYMYFFDKMKLREIAETVGKTEAWINRKINFFKDNARRKFEESMK